MRTISTNTFRDNLAELIDEVKRDDSRLIISRFGKPLVVLSPYKKEKVGDYKEYYGFLKDSAGVDGKSYVNKLRRSKKENVYISTLRKGKKPRG